MTPTNSSARSLAALLTRSLLLGAVGLTAAALGAGCGDDDDRTGGTSSQTPDEFAAASKLSFVDCGAVSFDIPKATSCPDTQVPAVKCFEQHLEDCSAARIKQTFTSDEGAPTTYDYFITPGDKCRVELFVDNRADTLAAPADRKLSHSSTDAGCYTATYLDGCASIQTGCDD